MQFHDWPLDKFKNKTAPTVAVALLMSPIVRNIISDSGAVLAVSC